MPVGGPDMECVSRVLMFGGIAIKTYGQIVLGLKKLQLKKGDVGRMWTSVSTAAEAGSYSAFLCFHMVFHWGKSTFNGAIPLMHTNTITLESI